MANPYEQAAIFLVEDREGQENWARHVAELQADGSVIVSRLDCRGKKTSDTWDLRAKEVPVFDLEHVALALYSIHFMMMRDDDERSGAHV